MLSSLRRYGERVGARISSLIWCAVLGGCHAPVLWVGSAALDGGTHEVAPLAGGRGALERAGSAAGRHVDPTVAEVSGAGHAASAPADPANMPPRTLPGPRLDDPSLSGHDAGMEPPAATAELRSPRLPEPRGDCPSLRGSGRYSFRAGNRSLSVQLTLPAGGTPGAAGGGPLVLYFHSLGADASEVTKALGQSAIDAVVAQGGVVASFQNAPCLSCGLPEDVVWYAEDDPVTDQVVACVAAQTHIDVRRIHATGFSSGAIHSLHLSLARSSFIASVVAYSGGAVSTPPDPQDPLNKVPALLASGRAGLDAFAGVDFRAASHEWSDTYGARGYYALLCDHDGGHEIPEALVPHALRFLLDHPYRLEPEPYARGVPGAFPAYCHGARDQARD